MARLHGRKGRLYMGIVSDVATAEPIAFVRGFSADFANTVVDVTAFGDDNEIKVVGLPKASGDFSFWYDDATAQTYTAATDSKKRKFYFYPSTDATTQYWFGEAFFSFKIDSDVNGAISGSGNWEPASKITKQG